MDYRTSSGPAMKRAVSQRTAALYQKFTPSIGVSDMGAVAAVVPATSGEPSALFLTIAAPLTPAQRETIVNALPGDCSVEVLSWRTTASSAEHLRALGDLCNARRVSSLLQNGDILYTWPVRSRIRGAFHSAPHPSSESAEDSSHAVAVRDGELFTKREAEYLRRVLTGSVPCDADTAVWAVCAISSKLDASAIAQDAQERGELSQDVLLIGLREAPARHRVAAAALLDGLKS